jgi:long-chain acyl-CoA synthetase
MSDPTQSFRPEYDNLVQVFVTAVEKYADRPLFGQLREGGALEWMTYREFAQLVDKFRAGLASLGVKRGDCVAVISNNRLEWAVGSHAALGLGASYVPMYEAQQDKEWEYILSDSAARICLVANAAVQARVEALAGSIPELQHIVNFEAPLTHPKSYASLLAYGTTHSVAPIIPDGRDIASLIYTSGTTGKPKGVMLSHANLAANVSALLSMVDVQETDRGVSFLPWAHIFGGGVELNLLIATGSSTAICSDPNRLREYLPLVKPTILFAVPRVWNKIYDGVQKLFAAEPTFQAAMLAAHKRRIGEQPTAAELSALETAQTNLFPLIRGAFGGELRFACSGAAALSREVAEFMDTLGIEVYEGYGMTETGGCTTAQPIGAVRLGSVGKPIPGVRLELDKSAAGANADEGEIIVYGTGVMTGYHNLPAATRDTLTPDGGLRTGDLGRIDADGYLYITGRIKELYKLENGKYVAPVPLEEKLQLSPYIAQCVVCGAERPHNVALIIPDRLAVEQWAKAEGLEDDGDALLTHPRVRSLLEAEVSKCNEQFKGYERISDFVIDSEELSTDNDMLTPTLKLKRRNVANKYGEVFDSLYPSAASVSDRPAPRASYIRELRPAAKTA